MFSRAFFFNGGFLLSNENFLLALQESSGHYSIGDSGWPAPDGILPSWSIRILCN